MSVAGLKRAFCGLYTFRVPVECDQSFGYETTEHIYFLSVLRDLTAVLVFIKLEVESVFFDNLLGGLSWQVVESFIDFSLSVCEDFELL